MLGAMCLLFVAVGKQKIPEQTTPTETSVPTATKSLNTSHQAFTSIYYNLH